MRQVLFRISFDSPWVLWGTDAATGQSLVGSAVLFSVVAFLYAAYVLVTKSGNPRRWATLAAVWGVLTIVVTLVGFMVPVDPEQLGVSMPIYGYGCMILIGFLIGLPWAKLRARTVGLDPETITDTGFWLLITAVAGGRIEYLRQYGGRVFQNLQGPGDAFVRAIDLRQGGLVLVGALVGGTIGVIVYARIRKISPWLLLDVVMPSAFLGIGFGRLGCLLNGCCYGDPCALPWGVAFPEGSVPFSEIVSRGFLSPDALQTMTLHPTQIYSSLNGFILAVVTALYFPMRRWNGELLLFAAMCYPITRFLIEFLRWDEMGQLATTLTISQKYSVAMFTAASIAWLICQWRFASRTHSSAMAPAGS